MHVKTEINCYVAIRDRSRVAVGESTGEVQSTIRPSAMEFATEHAFADIAKCMTWWSVC